MLNICNFAQEIISRPTQPDSLPPTPASNYVATNSAQLPEEDAARSPPLVQPAQAPLHDSAIDCRNEL